MIKGRFCDSRCLRSMTTGGIYVVAKRETTDGLFSHGSRWASGEQGPRGTGCSPTMGVEERAQRADPRDGLGNVTESSGN